MPFWSKPKKSEPEKREYKTLKGSVFLTDTEMRDAIRLNSQKNKPNPVKKFLRDMKKPHHTTKAQKEAIRNGMEDFGRVATFGFAGAVLTGRAQRQRKEKAQSDRIESLLRDIKNKK
jgi:hypothetical protein